MPGIRRWADKLANAAMPRYEIYESYGALGRMIAEYMGRAAKEWFTSGDVPNLGLYASDTGLVEGTAVANKTVKESGLRLAARHANDQTRLGVVREMVIKGLGMIRDQPGAESILANLGSMAVVNNLFTSIAEFVTQMKGIVSFNLDHPRIALSKLTSSYATDAEGQYESGGGCNDTGPHGQTSGPVGDDNIETPGIVSLVRAVGGVSVDFSTGVNEYSKPATLGTNSESDAQLGHIFKTHARTSTAFYKLADCLIRPNLKPAHTICLADRAGSWAALLARLSRAEYLWQLNAAPFYGN